MHEEGLCALSAMFRRVSDFHTYTSRKGKGGRKTKGEICRERILVITKSEEIIVINCMSTRKRRFFCKVRDNAPPPKYVRYDYYITWIKKKKRERESAKETERKKKKERKTKCINCSTDPQRRYLLK